MFGQVFCLFVCFIGLLLVCFGFQSCTFYFIYVFCVWLCVHGCMYACMYIVCMYVCMYVSILVYEERERSGWELGGCRGAVAENTIKHHLNILHGNNIFQ